MLLTLFAIEKLQNNFYFQASNIINNEIQFIKKTFKFT